MERGRAAVAEARRFTKGRSSTGVGPSVFGGNHFRTQEWFALEHVAAGDGLRQRRYLLAATTRLDPSKRLARSASSAAASLGQTRSDSTFAGRDRQCFHAGSFWGDHTGPNSTDRAKNGCKRHVITDARGVPLIVATGPANESDYKRAIELLDKLPAIAGRRGRPRGKPTIFQGDAAYGTAATIEQVVQRGIRPLLAPYGHTTRRHGSGLGKTRYVVERTLSWFGNFRRLKFCYERTAAHLQAFHELAACLICFNKLRPKRRNDVLK
jgi:transposase